MLINTLLLLFLKIRILKNFWNFTRKHLFWSLFSIKLQKLLKNTFFYRTPLVAGCTIKSTKGNMGLGVILTIGTILTTWHYAKIVQIRSYFWSVFSCIRTEYRKIRTRNNSVFGNFSRSVNRWKKDFNMSGTWFGKLVNVLRGSLEKRDTHFRKTIPVKKHVAVALWRLANGNSLRKTSKTLAVRKSTIVESAKKLREVFAV